MSPRGASSHSQHQLGHSQRFHITSAGKRHRQHDGSRSSGNFHLKVRCIAPGHSSCFRVEIAGNTKAPSLHMFERGGPEALTLRHSPSQELRLVAAHLSAASSRNKYLHDFRASQHTCTNVQRDTIQFDMHKLSDLNSQFFLQKLLRRAHCTETVF